MEQLYELFPDYARDLKLNLQNVLKQDELTEQQTWGTAAASAVAARNPQLIGAVLAEAGRRLSPEALNAAKAAAAVMGMNNIYYRFQHLSGNDRYGQIPARLRMQVIRSHGSDPVDFELWCTAVSAINGCGACVASHEKVLREKGVPEETILAAVRIASVIHGAAAVLDTEATVAAAAAL
ncbi:MAG TPA: carboxymuconolactone decarboxylase family protein [Bryobacteraceae bacterium]|nr:carboxymuconolactone decarboxylase family protein [Bryobacteraceae bacterium]